MRPFVLVVMLMLVATAAEAASPLVCKIGRDMYGFGRYGMALPRFDRCIERLQQRNDPVTLADAHRWRALTRMQLGDYDAALADIDEAFALVGDEPRVLEAQGRILAASGRPEEALATLEQAMALRGPDGVAHLQEHLRAAGYDAGPLDGVYGPVTRAALAACLADACDIWP